ncbi:MAG: FhaA domain-containing protein [Acidimicrobiia bacterium]
MDLARELEKRLERFVDGISTAIFRGRVHPVDIANRLVREADLAQREGRAGPEIPNRWVCRLAMADLGTEDVSDLERELTHALSTTAADRGWRTGGPVTVHVAADARARQGSIGYTSSYQPGAVPTWSQLLDAVAGVSHDIGDNRVLVGRDDEVDIHLDDPQVSRLHAVVFREAGKAWINDLGSANGTTVNGTVVNDQAVPLRPGDTVAFGPATFAFRMR